MLTTTIYIFIKKYIILDLFNYYNFYNKNI